MKYCNGCSTELDLSKFWKGQSLCVKCSSERAKTRWASRSPKRRLEQHLKYKYGISHAEFSEAWDKQDGKCAICVTQLPDLMTYDNRRRGYAIDHNHETMKFRGILCTQCNALLGMAKDSASVLAKAIGYLERNGSYAKEQVTMSNLNGDK